MYNSLHKGVVCTTHYIKELYLQLLDCIISIGNINLTSTRLSNYLSYLSALCIITIDEVDNDRDWLTARHNLFIFMSIILVLLFIGSTAALHH